MAEARNEYIKALHALSKTSPDVWANFVEHFKWITVLELEKMANSPPDHAQIAVGMAKKMKELRDDFVNIESIAEKLRK